MEKKLKKAKSLLSTYKENSVLFFTGDKESTFLLELTRDQNMHVIFVDTGLYLQEIYDYVKLVEKHWDFQAEILQDARAIEKSRASGREECYDFLKKKIVLPYLKTQGISSLIEPIKFEQETIEHEGIMSVFPLSGFSELEIWLYIKEKKLPYCELYNKGYKDVGCDPCSKSEVSKNVHDKEVSRRLKALGYL